MALVWISFSLLVVATSSRCSSSSIIIDTTSGLETLLCGNKTFSNNTVIMLDPRVNHTIRYKGFCTVSATSNSSSVTITSKSDHQYALINCNREIMSTFGTTGFFFWNLSSISIVRLVFSNCGAALHTLPAETLNLINSSLRLHFPQNHSAVLLINEICASIDQVNITRYFGFAILGRNIPLGYMNNISIYQNTVDVEFVEGGSGILLLFLQDKILSNKIEFKVNISQSMFKDNHIQSNSQCPPAKYKYVASDTSTAIMNGPDLTVIYSHNTSLFNVSTIVSNCTFTNNSGHTIGSVLMMDFNGLPPGSQFIVDSCNFTGENVTQKKYCGGSLLYIYIQDFQSLTSYSFPAADNDNSQYIPVVVSKTLFCSVVTQDNYLLNSAIKLTFKNVYYPLMVKFKSVQFIQNIPGVTAEVKNIPNFKSLRHRTVKIILEEVIATTIASNTPISFFSGTGSFRFYSIRSVVIKGSTQNPSVFSHLMGPIIKAVNTDVILQGQMHFLGSSSINGAAINVKNGLLFLESGVASYFAKLYAQNKGGAIHISSNDLALWGDKRCSIQISKNASAFFEYNNAFEAGSSVFITNLCKCYMGDNARTWINESTLVYDNAFKFSNSDNKMLRNVSTTPKQILICEQLDPNKVHYPGEEITFSVTTTAWNNHSVFAKISLHLVYSHSRYGAGKRLFWKLGTKDQERIIPEDVNNGCTSISVKILGDEKGATHPEKEIVVFIGTNIKDSMPLTLNRNCPLGFQLYNTTLSCDCSQLFVQVAKLVMDQSLDPFCNITTRTLPFLTQLAWVGTKNATFAISLHCNTDHCNTIPKSYYFKIENETYITDQINTSVEICQGNRKGILCSECIEDHSIVFGSSDCVHCSNWWILTVLLYAIAGPLLVYLLFILKLTLATGTLDGVLLYAHLFNSELLYRLRQHQIYSEQQKSVEILAEFCHVFLSMLNLNIGFPLCFYNGMNELWKSGLSLLFPLYLLLIVKALTVVSRYSSWLSNRISDSSVQVFVTIIHLSLSKLTLALTDVFSSTEIYSESFGNSMKSQRVWLNDGSVVYGSGSHLILMLLTTSIFCVFIIPYAVILTTGAFLMKQKCIRKYLRPYYEAIYGPFKNNRKYWFLLRILLVCIFLVKFLIFGRNQFENDAITISLLLIFIAAHTYAKPYKSQAINILDTVILLDYGVIIATTWYYYVINEVWKAKVIIITMVMIFFMIFVGIIAYHVLSAIQSKFHLFKRYGSIGPNIFNQKKKLVKPMPSHADDDFREPLLEPYD